MPVVLGTVYATTTDLANLGLIGGALSSMPGGAQTEALQAASAVADSYIGSHFVLPILQWGYDLVRHVCIIAAYDLLTSRGYNPTAGADPNIRERYLDSLKWLDEVGKGTQSPAQLVDSSSSATGTGSDGSPTAQIDGFGLITSSIRGWTDRGVGTPADAGNGWWW
jgi:phage gp36-like protein